jgi:hypothetical protein
VDKLVRVRRLLGRLAFLNDLPTKLAEMINHGDYREAVTLYNKTISVLTRHSHVLSFKKIKVRCALCVCFVCVCVCACVCLFFFLSLLLPRL